MSAFLKNLSYVIFPRRCELCGDVVELDKVRCSECQSIKMIEGRICNKCGRNVNNCTCSRDNFSPEYKSFCAPYYFENGPKRAVYRLKLDSFFELVPAMSKSIVKAMALHFEGVEFDVVTCVPMRKMRKLNRGFNQSELLAREIAKELNTEFEELTYKKRHTRSQRKSSAKQRRANLYNAFAMLDGKQIRDKTVLIVDDVKTTGTTLSENAYVLKSAGAKAVYAAAFTVTNKKS